MLESIIYLKDHAEKALQACEQKQNNFSKDLLLKSIEELISLNLNYHVKSGKSYFGLEKRSEYVNKSELPKYKNLDEVIKWEFTNEIANGASMLKRGYKIV